MMTKTNGSGAALSFSLGGTITTYSKNYVVVYAISFLTLVIAITYTVFLIPESFSVEKREELRRQRIDQAATSSSQSWILRMKSSFSIVLEPLLGLKPTYNPSTGKTNWRLLYCAAHVFIVTLADAYAVMGMIVYFTSRYHYTPAQVRYYGVPHSISMNSYKLLLT